MKHARADYDLIQDPRGLIPRDEPVVLLRAQDSYATDALKAYVNLMKRDGQTDLSFVTMMEAHIKAFEAWPKKKIPDVPTLVARQSGFKA